VKIATYYSRFFL